MLTRFTKWLPVGLVAAGFAFLGSPREACAVLELRATDQPTGTVLIVLDNGPGDSNPAVGTISLGSTVTPINFGGLSVLGSVSTSNSPGSPVLSQVASSSLSVTNTTGVSHTVVLQISDNNFNLPPSPIQLSGTASGTFAPVPGTNNAFVTGSTATALAFADPNNAKFVNGFLVQNFSTPVAGSTSTLLSYSNTQEAGPLSYNPAYAMTVQLTYVVPNNVQLNGRSDIIQATAVPEPATFAMALGGLPVLGVFWLRRRRQEA